MKCEKCGNKVRRCLYEMRFGEKVWKCDKIAKDGTRIPLCFEHNDLFLRTTCEGEEVE